MSTWLRALLVALWVVVLGLAAVTLEVEEVRTGGRIRQLLLKREVLVERIRQLELRYNRMLSPDELARTLPEEFCSIPEGPEPLRDGDGDEFLVVLPASR